ncbi:hypothetical protein CIN_00720 [Commensalibacter intestini A911]|uniref:Uncharacterized protein n=1 Tax=Commensalibacter intestini A911 TaxID=1088868 RepID=G6EXH6_9PROT|nr:hypothetical protein CIN_00720 [Commensalibacter intestini A911]
MKVQEYFDSWHLLDTLFLLVILCNVYLLCHQQMSFDYKK